MPHALVFSLHQLLGRAAFVESANRQGLYSTKTEGARAMAEPQVEPQAPDQRIYTREFKLEAVHLSESSEQTVAQIARDLGVPERVL
jgi:Transposase